MKKFNGYDEAKKQAQASGKLPEGAYICQIMGVKYEQADKAEYSDRILLQFDISEGDQAGFFRRQWDANTSEDRKWKGNFRLYVPKDDGSEKDGWTKRSFAGWIDSFEKSNDGYSWNWDEQSLKNKKVGIVFGSTGTVIDGREIVYTEPRFSCEVERIREGKAPEAPFKSKNGFGEQTQPVVDADGFLSVPDGVDEELPFR